MTRNQSSNGARKQRRGFRSWIVAAGTMGAIVAFSVGNSRAVTLACAHAGCGTTIADVTEQDQPIKFNIPAGPLGEALRAFEGTTGLSVRVTDEGIRTLASPGVSGLYTPEQALRLLLMDTGVSYSFTSRATISLDIRAHQESVDILAGPTETITSPKYTEPLRDTPQSISVVSRQVMEAQGATTLRDTLRNVAGISLAAGEGGAQGDSLTIRGFTARNDIFLDGMRDFGSYYRDTFNMNQVEVLKGPSSISFGRGTTGGVVNQENKTPQLASFMSGTVVFGTDLTKRATFDINRAIPGLGKGAAFRLNLMGNDSNVAGRDIAENRRYGIAPSLSLGLGTSTRATFSYFHEAADDIPDYGIPWLLNGPAAVPRQNYYGFKDGNFLKTNVDIGTANLEHDFNDNLSLRNQFRYGHYRRDVQITEPRVAGTITPATPLSAINVTRNQITAKSLETFLQNQTDVTAHFNTGPIKHTLVGGLEVGRETSDPTRFAFTGVPTTSLLHPDTSQAFAGTGTVSSKVQTTANTVGAYVLDTLKVGQKWEFTAGVRWDRFDARFAQFVTPVSSFKRVDEMTSWRGAAVYKPTANGSIYFAYGTSFNPSAESLSLTAGTANVAPEKNETFEVGSKWDLFSRKLSLRTAVFRTDKTNARETSPTNPLLVVLSGNQRVDGFELEASGNLTKGWQILSSYALLHSELVSSRFFPTAVGSQLANVPKNTFSLWTNYALPWKLTVGGGGQYIGSRTASSTVPLDPVTGLVKEVPGYWVFNAVVKYPLAEHFELQLNANNLFDKYYYDQIHPGHIVPGPGRSALFGLNFKF